MNDSMLSDLTNSIDPDYKSIQFILKNLKITAPRISDECDSLLSARREVSQSITYQLCFYVYCLLQAFKSDFETMKAPPDEGFSESFFTIRIKISYCYYPIFM